MCNKLKYLLLSCLLIAQVSRAQEVVFEGLKPVNGTELYCKVIGEGEPLVVLHGGPGLSHDYFLPHLLPLAKRFQLILFDQRAQGQSSLELDASQMSVQALVDDIEGIRQAFGLQKIHLMAHSWGASIAIRYAAQYPESLQSLILVSAVPLNPQAFEEKMQSMPRPAQHPQDSLERAELMASEAFKNQETAAIEKLLLLNFRRSAYDRNNMKKLNLNLRPTFSEGSQILGGMGPEGMVYDLTETAKKITCPTLVIHGKADIIPLEISLETDRTIPNASLRQLMKSGHFPFVEEPGKFNKIISKWMKEHASTKG